MRTKEASQVFQSRIMSGHGLYRRLANRARDKIAPAPGIYARHKFALYMSVHGKCDDPIARRSRRSVREMLPRPVFYRSRSLFGVRVRSGRRTRGAVCPGEDEQLKAGPCSVHLHAHPCVRRCLVEQHISKRRSLPIWLRAGCLEAVSPRRYRTEIAIEFSPWRNLQPRFVLSSSSWNQH